MKAELNNYRSSPRKTRLVANLMRGKSVAEASVQLEFLSKRAAVSFHKLLKSAVANAQHNQKVSENDLVVKDVQVNKGPTLKRSMPRSRGMSNPINKRTSHITLVLEVKK